MIFRCAPCCASSDEANAKASGEWEPSVGMMDEGAAEDFKLGPTTPAAAAAKKGDGSAQGEIYLGKGRDMILTAAAGTGGSPRSSGSPNGTTFTAVLTRASLEAPFGCKFDKNDQRSLEIISVSSREDTAVSVYNASAEPHLQMLPGRFVMSVNGVGGVTKEMEKQWTQSTTVTCEVCVPMEFEIELQKEESSKLGIDVDCCQVGRTIILVGLNEGLVTSWNAVHPELRVQLLDRITEVNGQRTQADLLLQLLKEARGKVKLVIGRPAWRPGEGPQ